MSTQPHDPIDPQRIGAAAPVDRVHFFQQVDSTNTAAIRGALNARPSDANLSELFLADRQQRGRGRGENRWWSGEGSLTFSLLTRSLNLPQASVPQLSLAVGVAVCQTLEPFVPPSLVAMKWPNDVFLAGRKACGVLIELPPGAGDRAVIGVGVNVSNRAADAPDDLRNRVTSVAEHSAIGPVSRNDVLINCLERIDSCIGMLEQRDPRLPELWRACSLLTGRRVRIVTPGDEITGVCESIADDGALIVRSKQGVRACYGGVVAEFE